MNNHSQHSLVIWIVNHYAQDPTGAGGTRHFSLAKQLKSQGFSPYIIAASTVHNQAKQRLQSHESLRIDEVEGIPFVWIKSATYESNGLKRLWNMLQFGYAIRKQSLLNSIPKPSLVIGSSPDPFAALGAERAAAKHNAAFLCEVRDFWPISLIELGKLSRFHPLAVIMFAIEKWLYSRAARILVVQPASHLYLTPRGVAEEKIVYLPNGIDLELFPEPLAAQEKEDITLMYFGAHGNGNALDIVLEAMKIIESTETKKHISLRLIGDGPLKPALQAMAKQLNVRNVSFEPPIPKRDIPKLAAEADILIFNVVDMPILRYGISANKLFDYMAAKRPIVFACNAINNPVAEAKAGLTVPAGNPQAMADAIIALSAESPTERAAMGERGRAFVTLHHSFSALGKKLSNIVREVLAQ